MEESLQLEQVFLYRMFRAKLISPKRNKIQLGLKVKWHHMVDNTIWKVNIVSSILMPDCNFRTTFSVCFCYQLASIFFSSLLLCVFISSSIFIGTTTHIPLVDFFSMFNKQPQVS